MGGLALYNYDLDESCYKVRLLLSFLGLEAERIPVNAFPGAEHRSPAFLALNPAGRLPVLRDGDLVLCGAEAILAHLARSRDPSGRWLPQAGPGFARTMQWLTFSATDLVPAVAARHHALFDAPGEESALRSEARRALRVMDDHLTETAFDGREWFAHDAPTIADVALFPAFALSRDFGIDHDEFPALRLWARRLRRLPGFITMPGIPNYH